MKRKISLSLIIIFLVIKIDDIFNSLLFHRKTFTMYFVRLFLVLIVTGVVLEKVSEDYEWFLNFLQYADPQQLENVPEGNNQ